MWITTINGHIDIVSLELKLHHLLFICTLAIWHSEIPPHLPSEYSEHWVLGFPKRAKRPNTSLALYFNFIQTWLVVKYRAELMINQIVSALERWYFNDNVRCKMCGSLNLQTPTWRITTPRRTSSGVMQERLAKTHCTKCTNSKHAPGSPNTSQL